mgnify:CR=1 FL=1
MKLSEILKSIEVPHVILNDSEFFTLGMLTSKGLSSKTLSFINNEKYIDVFYESNNITAIITSNEIYRKLKLPEKTGVIITKNPKELFYEIHNQLCDSDFYWKKYKNVIDETAHISENAIIAKHSVKIGKNSIIENGVVINSGTTIGDNVIVRSNSIISSVGFQFLNMGDRVLSVRSGGKVLICDNAEVQQNCCIDKGVFGGDTVIKKDVKIDNFVHIAHDCVIGERTFITAGVKFGGRTVVGNDCWLGVNATISNGLIIGNNVKVSLGSVVTKNIESDTTVTGNFAIEHSKFLNFLKSIR